jgi:hypothetical protein
VNNLVTFLVGKNKPGVLLGLGALLAGCADGDNPSDDKSGTEPDNTLPQIFVNEVMTSNTATVQDEVGAFPDWIELWNADDREADLEGWWITDDLTDVFKWQFPAGAVIPAGGFLILYADEDLEEGPMHVNFNLSASGGDDIGLFGPNGDENPLIDSMEQLLPISANWSFARQPDGDAPVIDDTPTPGEPNN